MKKLALGAIVILGLSAALGAYLVFAWWPAAAIDAARTVAIGRTARIRPDYHDATIPPNIAPLNFVVDEAAPRHVVRVRADRGEPFEVASRDGRIIIPPSRWRELLAANRGRRLYFDVYASRPDGQWTKFDPIVNQIAAENIDRYLFYRLIKPIYIIRVNVAIHQRDLESYCESTVLSNQSFGGGGGCVNCHTFAAGHPDRMIVHSRGTGDAAYRSGMLVVRRGEVVKVHTGKLADAASAARGRIGTALAGYTAWHPSGLLATFAAADMVQFFHAVGENRDVFDRESDLALYHVDTNTVTTTPNISQPGRLETFPCWSPDGRHLYFCSAAELPITRYRELRYDLVRISYDADTGKWGDVEPVLSAQETGLSITEPRVSPDGRWLLFCMSEYGGFPVFQPSSDLYLMDLKTRRYERLAINSPRSESWHTWSSNSRWMAFASKQRDGVFARVYFSYVDDRGRAHKPVVLPQQDPTFYDRFIHTYNAPELAPMPAPARGRALTRAVCDRAFFVGRPATSAHGG